ncbi:peptide/nickel transport system ATP-binding protein [Clostridium tetanomorphum]|uniref:ABC transporter ATP-binding protein n=1 Tax=Clostridium tetanomorphum TaxID=1553 RepID=UPI00044C9D76|nr:ATP-binding cassette domain-containing protein [Clostridium tetanomorphum]KAJ49802.1 dipeptide/oligopeptide/nickel ABC transporter ATPase [Clostridium tetanomorphum DSM 665]MBP1865103.1 peptide/nickel transport system ATP-binding protein [Clostridium tetanomorphum]NRS84758.1 peptide/nickel transport system ATP-binding protein [Clostridium tetanomorphum]SQB91739.1 dipeptide transport ATP-binding protein dppF [Clostridium tetanomorphum]
MIQIQDLCFAYDSKEVLSHVNFTLSPGECIGLLGESGLGKSTFAKLMCGILKPTSGQVLIDGINVQKIKGIKPSQLIFQHPDKAVNPKWRMIKTLNEVWNVDERTIKDCGIKDIWISRYPNELSGGELQRFCIARTLHPSVKYLIADEMTAMFDTITQAKIWSLMLNISVERNLGLFIISHDEALLKKLCNKVYVIRDKGEIKDCT